MEPIEVKVTGEFGLFTRPEAKVERVSYSVISPSAARGIVEAIFWKPEIKWQILQIQILNKPVFHSIVRNEVDTKATITKQTMENPKAYYSDDHRQLRHSLMLKDVAYIIKAKIRLQPNAKGDLKKYHAMFRRRLEKGQCFSRPYLGTRECAAEFSIPTKLDRPIDWTESLGPMFFDFRYPNKGSVITPYFFDAEIKNGIMDIPPYLYKEVNR